MPRFTLKSIVLALVVLVLLAPLAVAEVIESIYIAKLYCNGSLIAIGIIEGHSVTAYPPIAACGGYVLRTDRALLYLLSHGVRMGSVYTASVDGLRLYTVLYTGQPGYHALPVLYTVLLVLVGLSVYALMRREELELL